jgi:ATP-binding cassette subfamily B protein
MLLSLTAALEISLDPYLLKIIIDTTNKYSSELQQLPHALMWPAIFYVALTIIHNLHMRYWGYLCLKLFPHLRTEVITALYQHLSHHTLAFFQRHFSGELANKVIATADGIENLIKLTAEMILARIFFIVIAGSFLFTVHIYFTIVLIVWTILYVGNGYRAAKKTEVYASKFSEAISHLNGQVVDSVSNIISAKIFSNLDFEEARLSTVATELSEKDIKLQSHINMTHFYQGFLYTALVMALMAGLIYGRIHGWVTLGDFAFVLTLCISIATIINGLTQSLPTLAKEIGRCQQALDTIVTPFEIQDAPNAKKLIIMNPSIEFKNVYFGYHKIPFFNNLNIFIPAYQKIGLVGYSGSGKTTFINLILRLYDVTQGKILIDNICIKDIKQESLSNNIALIPQQPELFNRSIKENILYGSVKAADEEVYRAAKLAHCHEFIEQLKDGYDSIVGERGVRLSGGQRQRIAIARAILKNAPILILDEATAALDSFTEQQIQHSLSSLMQNKTVIVIAHRLATIAKMDRILFFQDGQIIEEGTLEQLKSKPDGHFHRFWMMQHE